MSANVEADGTIRQLDGRAEPDAIITEQDVQDPAKLARLLQWVVRELVLLRRRFRPRRKDFKDRVLDATGTTKHALEHGFGTTDVRVWVVGWSGAAAPNIEAHSDSDAKTLYVVSKSAGTATIRVEEGS